MFDEIVVTMDNDGDLITRAEAVKAALDWNVRPHEDVFDAIKSAIAVRMHAVPKAEGWVSVKDRMPETRHAVLVYTPHHKNIWAATMHEDGNWYIWSPNYRILLDPDWYGPITHWMPLPEVPEV